MKKFLFPFLITCLFLLASHPARAQFEAKIGPVALLFGSLSLAAEYNFSDEFSTELHTFLYGDGGVVWATAKYYLNPRVGADRFHLGGFLAAGSLGPGIGFMAGTKMVSTKNIIFDLGLGVGRAFDGELIPYGKIQIGYRFMGKR